ncbi:hypothetical protein [Cyclobacterium sp. SYSU L10401]|uniref:hypothetical protein n=1 Tax=Cyclobacterium sp. SYSU L10401 TaxID=2678657 RepID=UPI0013D01E88|nr:hypothetical protein [Cyclobacterium sp. SYSU L10401]
MHFSESEALASRNSRYLDGIGMMVSYGITGSMVAAVASPVLVRGLVDGLGARVVQRMGIEASQQMVFSYLGNGDLSKVDLFDIAAAGVFRKSAFLFQGFGDFTTKAGFQDALGLASEIGIGGTKSTTASLVDLGVGGFNWKWKNTLDNSDIDKVVINTISNFNNTITLGVGEIIKTRE